MLMPAYRKDIGKRFLLLLRPVRAVPGFVEFSVARFGPVLERSNVFCAVFTQNGLRRVAAFLCNSCRLFPYSCVFCFWMKIAQFWFKSARVCEHRCWPAYMAQQLRSKLWSCTSLSEGQAFMAEQRQRVKEEKLELNSKLDAHLQHMDTFVGVCMVVFRVGGTILDL